MNNEKSKDRQAFLDQMKGAILEVLLVSAKGIDHAHILGHPGYHVIVECGSQIFTSKTSSGNRDKIYWNEKLVFELPESELETLSHLKLRIVKEEHLSDDDFVGETIIFLRGIIVEGNYRGLTEILPAPFNVVLEDDTYKGEMTVGLKFTPNMVVNVEGKQCVKKGNEGGGSICSVITSIWKLKWWRLFSSYKNRYLINNHKDN
ncbi:elicitor-responsive protein 3 [Salvia miltiorrhiza]|uniref:elicitor-responsive protein 3 n=1 Tax=Salvia miltiorrhiza TaxID=226208 RepID=UPI0025AD90FF|nr:elicitor-responsive protein 3 [Salvia miltiorrhiza]